MTDFQDFAASGRGDLIDFLRETDHLSFREAAERLAQEAGISISSAPIAASPRSYGMTCEEECAVIEDALHHVLTAILAIKRPVPLSAAPMVHIMPIGRPEHLPTRQQSFFKRLATDPAGAALRWTVRLIGERLHELGGMRLMVDACQRLADRDEPNWGRRTSIIDAGWNGIGDWIS